MKSITTVLRTTLAAAALSLCALQTSHAQFERTVLLEELTSVTCEPCAVAGEIINRIAAENAARLATIRYHTYFRPPADRFYEANKTESDARRVFYEVQGIPVVRVDGTLAPPATDEQEIRNRVQAQLAIESPIKLEVTQLPIEGNEIRVNVKATAGPEGLPSGFKLRVASVEGFVHDNTFATKPTYNGEVDLHDIFRDMLPGPNGDDIVLGNNEVKTFSYRFPLVAGARADQMYAIAFVQDDFDKSVVQTAFSVRPTSSINREAEGYAARIASPNPTNGITRVDYTLGKIGRLDATVIDATGAVVRITTRSSVDAGDGTMIVEMGDLPAGTYTIVLTSGQWQWSTSVVVIQ